MSLCAGYLLLDYFFFFSSRRRHTRSTRDWSSDVCSSDLARANDPFSKFKNEQVETDVQSVVRASADTFQVTWTERHFKDGELTATEHWREIGRASCRERG